MGLLGVENIFHYVHCVYPFLPSRVTVPLSSVQIRPSIRNAPFAKNHNLVSKFRRSICDGEKFGKSCLSLG